MALTPPSEKQPKPGLNIYGGVAVNPYKLTIYAEELGIPYNYITLDFVANEPHAEWYTAMNTNGKMPSIVHMKEDVTVTVFESAACLLYMAHEFDKEYLYSAPHGLPDYWKELSWLQ